MASHLKQQSIQRTLVILRHFQLLLKSIGDMIAYHVEAIGLLLQKLQGSNLYAGTRIPKDRNTDINKKPR